jgi:TolB-like protein
MNTIHWWQGMLLMLLISIAAATPATAGQVVTPELREWARQAVEQEQQLETVTKPRSVAVLYFANPNADPELNPLQKGLAVMLTSDLARLDMLTVIERTALQALVEELGFGQSGLVDPDSAPRVGRLLQTEFLVGGSVVRNADGALSLSANVLDVRPAKIITRTETRGGIEQIFELEHQLVERIVTAMNLELTAAQKARLAQPLTTSPEALMNLFQGLDAGDFNQYEKASDYYQSALAVDPDLSVARRSLNELTALNLVRPVSASPAGPRVTSTQRMQLLRTMRNKTSFSTQLPPTLPLSRIPHPAAVNTQDERATEQMMDLPTRGDDLSPDASQQRED